MAKKTNVVTEVASALGAAAARVENLKPKRSTAAKHSKAKSAAAAATPVEEVIVVEETAIAEPYDREEIARIAYLYWEARGYQGGSPHEDWARAEEECRNRK
jgi:hypothetical protein